MRGRTGTRFRDWWLGIQLSVSVTPTWSTNTTAASHPSMHCVVFTVWVEAVLLQRRTTDQNITGCPRPSLEEISNSCYTSFRTELSHHHLIHLLSLKATWTNEEQDHLVVSAPGGWLDCLIKGTLKTILLFINLIRDEYILVWFSTTLWEVWSRIKSDLWSVWRRSGRDAEMFLELVVVGSQRGSLNVCWQEHDMLTC